MGYEIKNPLKKRIRFPENDLKNVSLKLKLLNLYYDKKNICNYNKYIDFVDFHFAGT